MIDLHTFCVFFCRYNQDQFYMLCLLQLPIFQGLKLLETDLWQFEDICSFFVILFRNTINSKTEPAAVLFLLMIALLGFFVLLYQCCYLLLKEFLVWFHYFDFIIYFIFYFCKSYLISLLKFSSVLLLTSNEFFNSLNLLTKFFFNSTTS